jgi:hypothetical protein
MNYEALLRIRIRSDPDLLGQIRIRIQVIINYPFSISFMYCFMNILFRAYFRQKISKETWPKMYVRIQIRIRKISKVGSGSTTLL